MLLSEGGGWFWLLGLAPQERKRSPEQAKGVHVGKMGPRAWYGSKGGTKLGSA